MKICKRILLIALVTSLGAYVVIAINKNTAPAIPQNTSPEIWVITDVHFLSQKLRDDGPRFVDFIRSGDGKNLLVLDTLLSGFMKLVEAHHPQALLVTGDLTLNGEKESHEDLATLFRQIEGLGTAVYVIPGNHDIQNPWARGIKQSGMYRAQSITVAEFASIYADFGYAEALSRDESTLSYLIEPLAGLQVLMLDTCKYDDNLVLGSPQPGGQITEKTRAWIRMLALSAMQNGKQMIVAMHHPILEHNPMVKNGFVIDDNLNLLKFFSSLHIRTFLSGHIHIQDIISEELPTGTMLDITTNALSVYPHNFAKISEKDGVFTYEAVSLSAQREIFGEDFSTSLKDFFLARSNRMAQRSLQPGQFNAEEEELIKLAVANANMNFFSGKERADAISKLQLDLLLSENDSFQSQYVLSILEDSPPSDQTVTVQL